MMKSKIFKREKAEQYCFHIKNLKEMLEKDPDFSLKLEKCGLPIDAFALSTDPEEGTYCIFVPYKKDLKEEKPDFSVGKMTKILKGLGLEITGIKNIKQK